MSHLYDVAVQCPPSIVGSGDGFDVTDKIL